MGLAQNCYESDMRLYRDAPHILTRGRWYLCPPDAKAIPFPHLFSNYTLDAGKWKIDPPIGEVPESRRWVKDEVLPFYTGQDFCGSQDLWQNGSFLALQGTPAVNADGVPLCCVGAIEIPGGQEDFGQAPSAGPDLAGGDTEGGDLVYALVGGDTEGGELLDVLTGGDTEGGDLVYALVGGDTEGGELLDVLTGGDTEGGELGQALVGGDTEGGELLDVLTGGDTEGGELVSGWSRVFPTLWNTGVDADGIFLLDEADDSHWTVTPEGGATAQALAVVASNPHWLFGEDVNSAWISDVAGGFETGAGPFDFETTFTAVGDEAGPLTARFMCDDGTTWFLNGVEIASEGPGFTEWRALSLDLAELVPGVNTLRVRVSNEGGVVMGLRVAWD